MTGIYHSADLDGVTCGALFKIKYPKGILIPYDYHQPLIKIDEIPDGETVVMMDVSLPKKDMIALASRCNLTWIDHHAAIMKTITGIEYPYNGIVRLEGGVAILCVYDGKQSACELTHSFLQMEEELSVAGSLTVAALGRYDTWRVDGNWEKRTLPFQYGMRAKVGLDVRLMGFWLKESSLPNYDQVIKDGKMVIRYQRVQDKLLVEASAFECTMVVNGKKYEAIAINAIGLSSDVFTNFNLRSRILVQFHYQRDVWKVSMRCNGHTNVAEICGALGGGGHPNAAGCVLKYSTWFLKEGRTIRLSNGEKSGQHLDLF